MVLQASTALPTPNAPPAKMLSARNLYVICNMKVCEEEEEEEEDSVIVAICF
jgi:hypothetical protein